MYKKTIMVGIFFALTNTSSFAHEGVGVRGGTDCNEIAILNDTSEYATVEFCVKGANYCCQENQGSANSACGGILVYDLNHKKCD